MIVKQIGLLTCFPPNPQACSASDTLGSNIRPVETGIAMPPTGNAGVIGVHNDEAAFGIADADVLRATNFND